MLRAKHFIYIFLLAFLWSFTFLIVRMCIFQVAPISLTFYRLIFAAALMIVVAMVGRIPIFQYTYAWKRLVVSSLLLNALPFTLCSIGEIWVESSTTGIIEGTTPLFTLLFSYLFVKGAHIYKRQVVAFVLGFIGLLVIFVPCLCHVGAEGSFEGFLALIGMAVSFALGFLFVERKLKEVPPIAAVTIQMFIAPFLVFPFIFLIEGSLHELPGSVMILLAVLGCTSSLGWVVYFLGIRHVSAANLSLSTMICPVLTILWGRVFLNETITWYKITGTLIVVISLLSMGNFFPDLTRFVKNLFHTQRKK